jgi:hypothetical protein
MSTAIGSKRSDTENTMLQSDDVGGAPQLDFGVWRGLLHSNCGDWVGPPSPSRRAMCGVFSPSGAWPAANWSIRIGLMTLHISFNVVRCSAWANLSMRMRWLAPFATMRISHGSSTSRSTIRRVLAQDGTAVVTLCALVPEKVRPRHATSHFGRPRHHLRGRKPFSGTTAARWASFRP